jgi:predicted lipid-binding transport protein (Tim44 family)
MSEGFAYIDILFFAMVAAFIALRLRSVLGRRTGHERRRTGGFGPVRRPNGAADNVVTLPERSSAQVEVEATTAGPADNGVKAGLTQIRLADQRFDLQKFLGGARAAFEMIVEAFAEGDKATLRPLLADGVYNGFERVIDERQTAGHKFETQLTAVPTTEVAGAEMRGKDARVTVRFKSEQINLLRDSEGKVLDGDPQTAVEVVDLWTFERDTTSQDPNWTLVETRTPN